MTPEEKYRDKITLRHVAFEVFVMLAAFTAIGLWILFLEGSVL